MQFIVGDGSLCESAWNGTMIRRKYAIGTLKEKYLYPLFR